MNRLTILGVCLLMSLLVTSAYGHGDGKCLTDADGNVRLDNGRWVKIIEHLLVDDLDGYKHGHLYEYYNNRGKSTGQGEGFFIDFDDTDGDSFADCPTPPVRRRAGASGLTPNPESNSNPIIITPYEPEPEDTYGTIEQPTPTTPSTPVRSAPVNSCDPPEPVSVYNPIIPIETVEVAEEVIEEINEVAEEIIEEVIPKTYRFEYGYWFQGYNLVSFPVLPEGVITIKDLFDRYSLFQSFELINENPIGYTGDRIVVNVDGDWLGYGGKSDNPIGDIEITPYMGFALLMDYAAWIAMNGRRLIGDGIYGVQEGMNFLGITQMPVGINKPSDFLLIDGVEAVISRVITDWGKRKELASYW